MESIMAHNHTVQRTNKYNSSKQILSIFPLQFYGPCPLNVRKCFACIQGSKRTPYCCFK